MPSARASIAAAAVLALAHAGRGAAVDAAMAADVARNFVASDAVGSALLAGRRAGEVRAKGMNWAVKLEPEGYVIVAGDDAARPVIAFSPHGDADEGDGANAFGEMLRVESGAALGAAAGEAFRESSFVAAALDAANAHLRAKRAERWVALAESAAAGGTMLMGLVNPQPRQDVVQKDPLLSTKWSQWQPYNDFSPVYSQADGAYRGRMPCGCVATAYAQILNYWRWPARFDGVAENKHPVSGTSVGEMHYRVDGSADFDYAGMLDGYVAYSGGYDLRGKVDERVRYGVGRLVQYAGTLARMQYGNNGSAALLDAPCRNNTLYGFGRSLARDTLERENFAPLKNSIMNGIPAMVGVPGHAIVADGWAEDGLGNAYVHFNYGWGGQGDGYYTLDETDTQNASSGYVSNAITGHMPKKTPAIRQTPRVSALPFTLEWEMPQCHEGTAGSFTVKHVAFGESLAAFADDFSGTKGQSSHSEQIYATPTITLEGVKSEVLWFGTLAEGGYEYPETFMLTGRSRIAYKVLSKYALGMAVKLQLREEGGTWETIDAPKLVARGNSAWRTWSVFLGDRAGKTVNIRWFAERTGDSYYPSADMVFGVFVDDLSLDDVLQREVSVKTVDGNATSATFGPEELAAGRLYAFTVSADGGEASASATTRIEGRYRVPLPQGQSAQELAWSGWREAVALPAPEIRSVTALTGAAKQVAEGFYRECSRGTNVLLVACSEGVVELSAASGNATLVANDRIATYGLGGGRFAVVVDGRGVDSRLNRSRVIFTLKARNANGTEAAKDIVLRFSDEGERETFEEPEPSTPGGAETGGVRVPYSWLVAQGLAAEGADDSAMESAAREDSDGDGFPNWQEYVCGTDPKDADDKFEVYIRLVDGNVTVEWSRTNAPLAEYVVEGKRNLGDANWEPLGSGAAGCGDKRFFRVVLRPR